MTSEVKEQTDSSNTEACDIASPTSVSSGIKHCQQYYDLPLFNSMNLPYIITSPAQQNEDMTYTNYITITLNYVNRKWEKKLRTVLAIGIFVCKFVLL